MGASIDGYVVEECEAGGIPVLIGQLYFICFCCLFVAWLLHSTATTSRPSEAISQEPRFGPGGASEAATGVLHFTSHHQGGATCQQRFCGLRGYSVLGGSRGCCILFDPVDTRWPCTICTRWQHSSCHCSNPSICTPITCSVTFQHHKEVLGLIGLYMNTHLFIKIVTLQLNG